MMKISEYKTACETSRLSIDDSVDQLMSLGYQPYGNPYLSRNGVARQAMVKHEEEASTVKSSEKQSTNFKAKKGTK